MKLTILFLLICLLPAFLFAQDNSLLYSYKIPTYSYHSMKLYGQDFFSYLKTNFLEERRKTENIDVSLGLNETYIIQSPMVTRKIYGLMSYKYSSRNNITSQWTPSGYQDKDNIVKSSDAVLAVMGFNSWYLNNEKGFSFFGDPGILYEYDLENKLSTHTVDLPIGVGYGRIIGVKSLVQAYVIADEIGITKDEDTLLKIADLIDKYNDGLFHAKYRDNAEIEYHKELAALTNKPSETAKIEQITKSQIFKLSERFTGWQIKLGFNLTYLDVQTWEKYNVKTYTTAYDLFASAEYALPIEFNKQVLASISYSKNLKEEISRLPKLKAEAQFIIDHNYHWSSVFSLGYYKAFPKEGDSWTNLYCNLKTDYLLLNSFSIYASLNYWNNEFRETYFLKWAPLTSKMHRTESIEFHLGFNYYIL